MPSSSVTASMIERSASIWPTAATTSAAMIPATAAAPAATVIGTWNRRQWSQAAPAATAAATAASAALPASLLVSRSGPTSVTKVKAAAANTPPTNASSNRIDGSAIRRRAVKNSASPHAVAATSAAPSGEGPAMSTVQCSAWPIAWPIQPTANSRMAAAIVTKISLNPVSSRKCSSSTAGKAAAPSTKLRKAAAASEVIAPAATASSMSCWLYMIGSPVGGESRRRRVIVSIH